MSPGDPRLVDRTGTYRLGTTDPKTRTICLDSRLRPPMVDRVLLHEIAHAVTMAHGLLDTLHMGLSDRLWTPVEEWSAQLVENHAMEAVEAATMALGRTICIGGLCSDRLGDHRARD